jgi:hypothetical protein
MRMTPEPICDMMARMSLPEEKTDLDGRRTVNDPCCGSRRMLLSAAKMQPNWHFVGQDVDLRCVRMTAINLGLRNLYGHVVHGNSLSNAGSLIYETGRVEVWGNSIREVNRVPLPDREPERIEMPSEASQPQAEASPVTRQPSAVSPPVLSENRKQLELF